MTLENLTRGNTNLHAVNNKSLSDISELHRELPKQTAQFSSLAARDLYLQIRSELILQTEEFLRQHNNSLNLQAFREWLDIYPFLRS